MNELELIEQALNDWNLPEIEEITAEEITEEATE